MKPIPSSLFKILLMALTYYMAGEISVAFFQKSAIIITPPSKYLNF